MRQAGGACAGDPLLQPVLVPGIGVQYGGEGADQAGQGVLLAEQAEPWWSQALVKAVAELAATEQERTRTRTALLSLLTRETKPEVAQKLAATVARLSPAVADLGKPGIWPCAPTHELLAQGFVKVASGVQPGESPVRSRSCRAWRGSCAQWRVSAV